MTDENLNPEEKPEGNSPEGGQETVSVEDFKNLQKGVEKLAESMNSFKKEEQPAEGKEAKPEDNPKEEAKPAPMSNVVRNLYLKENPEFTEVEDEVKEEARQLGVDPIDYYESKQGWKLEAKVRAEARKKEEEAKSSIEGSNGKPNIEETVDFSKIKPEQVKSLSPKQMDKYREHLRSQSGQTPITRRN